MTRRTKALAISPEVKRRVLERDGCCVYCGRPGAPNAHYIPRSQGGLGIEENILTLCAQCHRDYDFGPNREAMGDFFRDYLSRHYADWDEFNLYYRKEVYMLNHITLMGRLTRDPELRYTQSGTPVASFTLAVDRDFKGPDGETETDFIDCVAWRQTGEFVSKYFTKGMLAVVSGRLQFRGWTDKNDNKRRNAEVVTDNVYFGESKRRNTTEYTPVSKGVDAGPSAFADLAEDDRELPF